MRLTTGLVAAVLAISCGCGGTGGRDRDQAAPAGRDSTSCIGCHEGIEAMHTRGYQLTCVDCHGGDGRERAKELAHVRPSAPWPEDARTLPLDHDPAYVRFRNPTDLRVIRQTCGRGGQGTGTGCHAGAATRVMKSMMATTAGHLAGGAYQNGLIPTRTPVWGNFDVSDDDGVVPLERGAVPFLRQIPPLQTSFPPESFQRHYSDVPRKVCTRCHLWSRGVGFRGSPDREGLYRAEGCAACHVLYADDGLSRSADPNVNRTQPGHPVAHRLTTAIPTGQCAHCHVRGARIGLAFQGYMQLPPGVPAGPGIPGTTERKLYGSFLVRDDEQTPPDIHHQVGMACIDCHVEPEIMGDGNLYGHMDQATEIECEDCHGTPSELPRLVTARGTPYRNLRWRGSQLVLTSKVTGREHPVPVVKDIVDPRSPVYNPAAARAMNADHLKREGGLECYACHSAWQPTCFGCHFERDERRTAFDMIAGAETPGRPVTDDRFFVRFRPFLLGYNSEGKVAPYTTGCQVYATVIGPDGRKILDEEMPVSGGGASGLSLNPVHNHTNRADRPRGCVECHRNPVALGLGSGSFLKLRRHVFVVERDRGVKCLTVKDLFSGSPAEPVGEVPVEGARHLAVRTDDITGLARLGYVAAGARGLRVLDLGNPAAPGEVGALATTDARHAALTAGHLFVADGAGGLLIAGLTRPSSPVPVRTVATREARAVAVWGTHAFVADGPDGLVVVDISDPARAEVVARLDLNGPDPAPNQAWSVSLHAHFRVHHSPAALPFAVMAYVADGTAGLRVVDLSEPSAPAVVATAPLPDTRGVWVASNRDRGGPGVRSIERDYAYVAGGATGLRILDVTDPIAPRLAASLPLDGMSLEVTSASRQVPPDARHHVYVSGERFGLAVVDVTASSSPSLVASFPGDVAGAAPETIALDRLVDEEGRKIKDASHDGARPFTAEEMRRILRAPVR